MSLSAIMGHAGLAGYAIAGMVVFIAVFATILLRLWWQGRAGDQESAGGLPLDDGRLAAGGGDHAPGKREEGR